ncbi:unnamed protein product [Zymoseptoria tritici ST99CH_1E4]|uniref:Inclusion body clearance protein IML2 n=1 Tax=Zymoseptoria tritici ST99CH_1E4 TaxID=1276532 RepID=A0A2H1FPT7_ZYMTR|nr:unnamed protein product [Zymoseptoria tritici ST99CH_1E4]
MKRFGGWLSSPAASLGSSKSLTALDEPHALEEAMSCASHILNDDVERAEAELSQGTSPFHKLGRALTFFLRATLSFEKEMIEQTSQRLAEAEESASEHQRRALRDPTTAHQSKIYPVGSEYALCHAETQLMSAVIGVLNESLTESLRGFYKLRKAFTTLSAIMEAENAYLKKHFPDGTGSSNSSSKENSSNNSSGVMTPAESEGDDKDDLDFQDADEAHSDLPTPVEYQGHLEMPGNDGPPPYRTEAGEYSKRTADVPDNDIDFRKVTTDPVDLFTHSGVALCFGLLQLLISMIPPAFSKLLSILSFRGDRETGLQLLWRSTKFNANINGGMAGLIVLGFHGAAVAVCDIHTREAFPRPRLAALLQEMRTLYPKSVLWILEEARLSSADRKLEQAVQILERDSSSSALKQVEALRVFEKSLALMYLHDYEACAESFLHTLTLNNWSHGLYYYIAACCHIELYRIHASTEPSKASGHKNKAKELFKLVMANTGKKKFMARQLPLDVFVVRKITKWTHRAKARDCDVVDAVGVSPLVEMTYFWSGFSRMGKAQLEKCIARLAWSEQSKAFDQEPVDERAILGVLQATCLRNLHDLETAKTVLNDSVFCYSLPQIKACEHADAWTLPVAHYEMAVCWWQEAGGQDGEREKLMSCSGSLVKVEKWEAFELDARVGLKITTARETLRRCGIVEA